MYCSKCGEKLKEGEKFCSKCGQAPHAVKEKPEAITKKTAAGAAAPVKKKNPALVCCGVLLILAIVPIIIFMGFGSSSKSSTTNFTLILTYLLVAAAAALTLWLIYKFIMAIIKKQIGSAIALGIIIAVIVGIGLGVYYYQKGKEVSSYGTMQDAFSSALAARYLGDDIVAGRSTANFSSVKTQTAAATDALSKVSPPSGYSDYYNAIYDWSKKLNDATASKKAWKSRPDTPVAFATPVKGYGAKNMFQASLDRIVSTKDYGDLAIAKGDRDLMRYIAAELEAEYTSLGNISTAYAPPTDRFAEILVQPAEAKNSLRFPRGRCPDFGPCHTNTRKKLPPTYQSAHRYSVGDPSAPASWTGAWDDMLKTISIDNGYNVAGAGITNGSNPNQVSPMEQAFNDECHAKGGTPGGSSVKDRLPTTLSTGWNCNYPNGSQTCWDYLTTAGQRFMGGGSGCPEQGLLPKPPVVNSGGGGTSGGGGSNGGGNSGGGTTSTWNGTYHVTYSTMSCNTTTSVGYSQMFNAAGFSDTVVVSGNKVTNFDGTTSQIDSSGNATFVYSMSYPGSGTVKFTSTYHFSGSSVNGKISMTVDVTTEGGTGNVTCSETFSGSK